MAGVRRKERAPLRVPFAQGKGQNFVARRFTHEQAISAIVVSYYWHFVDIVWVALFFAIYVIR